MLSVPGGTSLLVPCGAHSVSLSLCFWQLRGPVWRPEQAGGVGAPGGPGRLRELLGPPAHAALAAGLCGGLGSASLSIQRRAGLLARGDRGQSRSWGPGPLGEL